MTDPIVELLLGATHVKVYASGASMVPSVRMASTVSGAW